MPLLLLLGGFQGLQQLVFVDSTGQNPLPAGVIVSLTAGGVPVGTAMLQAGGICPIPFTNGTYVATFTGTQAPTTPVGFTATAGGTTEVVVPGYQSPVYSVAGYAIESIAHLTRGWFVNPGGG